jgi:heme exporter protein C
MSFSTTRSPSATWPKWLTTFGWITAILLVSGQIYAIVTSPPDAAMGDLQKIMYIHVPSAWVAMMSFIVVLAYCLLYLWKHQPKHDLMAASAAEVGTVFTALAIAQGSIWGRPTWGVWWTWDARLTSTAVMLLIYAGYLTLRSFTDDEERRARWSAAVGILGAINVPIVWYSVKWWRTIHQLQSDMSSISPEYRRGWIINALTFTVLVVYLIVARYHVSLLQRAGEQHAEEQALAVRSVHV